MILCSNPCPEYINILPIWDGSLQLGIRADGWQGSWIKCEIKRSKSLQQVLIKLELKSSENRCVCHFDTQLTTLKSYLKKRLISAFSVKKSWASS